MADVLQHFNSKLVDVMNTKQGNSGFLTKERYDDLLIKVNNSKNRNN